MLVDLLVLALLFVACLGFAVLGRVVLAAIAIVTGDKSALRDFGNLCEKDDFSWLEAGWKDRDHYRKGR